MSIEQDTSTSSVVYSSEPEDFRYIAVNIPCQEACPAYTNVPAYIRALYENRYDDSYEINRLVNIFPGILGRVCSRPCEDFCRHGESGLGRPVNICHIKRAAADLRREPVQSGPRVSGKIAKRVAIVGSGPAGLAAAHDLATVGFSVTIFEALNEPGGMLRYGIPEFRLPRQVVREEVGRIIDLGITLKTGVRVGRDLTLPELLRDYDGVLLAAGCYEARRLNIEGEDLSGVYSGLEFMMEVCQGRNPAVGERVLVVGAGFTAFDCARTSLRLGAKEVRICLRRTEEDLTVTRDEIHEAKREGVRIESLMLSRRINGDDRVTGVEFVRTRPGEKNEQGKSTITPIEGSEFIVEADTVIVATGQSSRPMALPGGGPDEILELGGGDGAATGVPGLYATGDYLTGPTTVIGALARGRRAAEEIARDLAGHPYRQQMIRMEETVITDRERSWDFLPRQEMATVADVAARLAEPGLEVETGYTEETAATEARRCYLCYLHYEIDLDRCIYCRYCIDMAPRDCIKLVEEIKTDEVGAISGLVETKDWARVNAVVIDNSPLHPLWGLRPGLSGGLYLGHPGGKSREIGPGGVTRGKNAGARSEDERYGI